MMGESKRRREFYQQQPHQRLGDAPVDAAYHERMTAIMLEVKQTEAELAATLGDGRCWRPT